MSKVNIKDIIKDMEPTKKLFHNEYINTYLTELPFEAIRHYQDNLRTLFAFDVLEADLKKKIEDISLEEITSFLAKKPKFKLNKLAKSIKANGVRVPLIILDDMTLLDGNRRYFACSYLYHNLKGKKSSPDYLKKIPVWVIKQEDITEEKQNKILAEANFVDDLKVPWTTDVKALVISNYFKQCSNAGHKERAIYTEIEDIYGLKKNEVLEFVESIELTEDFFRTAGKDNKKKLKLREIVQKKFIYFWEFRNKANKQIGKLDKNELIKIKDLFFKMMENNCFMNFKQVEPMISAYHDEDLWEMLVSSKGTKINQVVAIINEQKAFRATIDKVRNFHKWLNKQIKAKNIDSLSLKHLRMIAETIDELEGE